MKFIFVAALMCVANIANANVLCEIVTKDPRYNVASYIRSQTACVTTRNVTGTAGIGPAIAAIGVLRVLTAIVEKSNAEAEENRQKDARNAEIADHIGIRCFGYDTAVTFALNDNRAVNLTTGESYTQTSENVYKYGQKSLNVKSMRFVNQRETFSCFQSYELRDGVTTDTLMNEVSKK